MLGKCLSKAREVFIEVFHTAALLRQLVAMRHQACHVLSVELPQKVLQQPYALFHLHQPIGVHFRSFGFAACLAGDVAQLYHRAVNALLQVGSRFTQVAYA